jgi:hypothetical protein
MRVSSKRYLTGLAMVLMAAGIAAQADASCAVGDWANSAAAYGQFQALSNSTKDDSNSPLNPGPANPSIVGLWKVTFTSKGTAGIPDGTVLDFGYVTWHSDGTELMNSSRPPKSGDFCMGVWKLTGPRSYRLHHVTLGWDPTGSYYEGPGDILEDVTLSRSGNAYTGTFVIDQYAPDGITVIIELKGTIAASRITADD